MKIDLSALTKEQLLSKLYAMNFIDRFSPEDHEYYRVIELELKKRKENDNGIHN